MDGCTAKEMVSVGDSLSCAVTMNAFTSSSLINMVINWKVDTFSFRQHITTGITSPVINSAELGLVGLDGEWLLVMTPKVLSKRENEEKEREFVSLHLRRDTNKGEDVPARFWLRIMDEEGKACLYRRDCTKPVVFAPKSQGTAMWGWDRFIAHEDLFSVKNKYLPNDSLFLRAEIQCLAWTKSTEDISVISGPTMNCAPTCSLKEDFAKMYRGRYNTDFVLVAGDGTQHKANSNILIARCEYFHSMLTHDTKEKIEMKCHFKDLDGDTLDSMLEYLYSGTVERLKDVAEKLLKASDQYCIQGLKVLCERHLASVITVSNAGRLILLADMHSCHELEVAVKRFLVHNLDGFVKAGGMTEVAESNSDTMTDIMIFVSNHSKNKKVDKNALLKR